MTTKPIYTFGRYQHDSYDGRYKLVENGEDWHEDRSVVVAMVEERNAHILAGRQAEWKRWYDQRKSDHDDAIALFEAGRRSDPGPFLFASERPLTLAPEDGGYDVIEDTLHLNSKEQPS